MNLFDKKMKIDEVSKVVDKLNDIKGLNNKFIYQYNATEEWFDIIHSIENEIQNNDKLAERISDILIEDLIQKEILNFSFYEDREELMANTIEFLSNRKTIFKTKPLLSNDKIIEKDIVSQKKNTDIQVTWDNIKKVV
ncbi:hypothetical protein ACP3TM_11380 [Staphylococcus sp. IPLA37010]|uniref:Uncharacterized protein n=1 Tax=Staphylococcus equorum TaxID=246432 RepID=A0AAW7AML4_9STAP|nr:hypothetical protein [Staphylococcus equorum]MDK9866755.1 hypothetical protein [Staphylococcus equorum]